MSHTDIDSTMARAANVLARQTAIHAEAAKAIHSKFEQLKLDAQADPILPPVSPIDAQVGKLIDSLRAAMSATYPQFEALKRLIEKANADHAAMMASMPRLPRSLCGTSDIAADFLAQLASRH